MFKRIFVIVIITTIALKVKCQSTDTAITYYKKDLMGYLHQVSTLDSADFLRMILDPDPGDDRYNVKEYYAGGGIKLVGKANPRLISQEKKGEMLLEGDCISFFPNGKKQSVIKYTAGNKEGMEYLYYPGGSVYSVRKNFISHRILNDRSLNLECYDANGIALCKEGNGQWIIYDADFKNILIRGEVKKGLMVGDWDGYIPGAGIKYSYRYKNGSFTSGTGYDKNGTAYPFTVEKELADYRGGPITFIDVLKYHLKRPRDSSGKKIPLDTVHVEFVVEKDGHLSHFRTLGKSDPVVFAALSDAFLKCRDWAPSRYYGIPFRTRVVLPLKYIEESYGVKQIFFNEYLLDD